MEISQVSAPLREKRRCQPKLVRTRSIGPGTLRALQQPSALGFASWPCLPDTTSTASSLVIDLFSASIDLQRFFLNRGVQCARLDPFSDDNAKFRREFKSFFLHLGKRSDPRRNAIVTSILTLCCQNSSSLRCATRPWGLPAPKISDKCQVTKDTLCVAACLRAARACISFKIPFRLTNPLVLVGCNNLIDDCIVVDIHHRRKATRLVFGGQSGRACFHILCSCRFRCHGKHGF